MKKSKSSLGGIYARLNRIERACARIEGRVAHIIAMRSIQADPRQEEIDSLVSKLLATSKAIAKECEEERLYFENAVKRNR